MLIVSWNVAGLRPALQRIHSDYSTNGGSNSGDQPTLISSSRCVSRSSSPPVVAAIAEDDRHPFATYLRRHGHIDILCLQEHKIPYKTLADRSEPYQCSSIPGYESYWSCVTNVQSRGFNGVVTYAKCGTVRSADAAPLGVPELDEQGRCIMTDHGYFVIFNVYVPGGGGARKMIFFNALQDAMERQRREFGKRVILVACGGYEFED